MSNANREDRSDNFELTKRMLKLAGISLKKENNLPYRIYSTLILSINIFPFLQFIGVPKYLRTEKDVFEFILFQACLFVILAKISVLYYNRIPLGVILDKLQSGLLRPNVNRGGIEEEAITKYYIGQTRKLSIIYWSGAMTTAVFAITDSIIWRFTQKELSWRYEYGPFTIFNATYSPNFEIAFLAHNLSWMAFGWMYVVSELSIVAVLANITCQLKILQNSIRRLVLNSYMNMLKARKEEVEHPERTQIDPSTIPWEYLKPVVEDAVKYHLTIIEIAQEIEEIFNVLVLIILLSDIGIIAGFLYRFERVHFGGIFAHLCENAMINYWGNEVSRESQNVMDACYEVNFLGADLRFQRSLFLIMERSKRPIVFTAGKFSPLTLSQFVSILRAAYSFLLILRTMT